MTENQADAFGHAITTNERNLGQGVTSRLAVANATPISEKQGILPKAYLAVKKIAADLENQATEGVHIAPIGSKSPYPVYTKGVIAENAPQVQSLVQQIRVRKAAGLDTTPQETQLKTILPGLNLSKKQIAGAALGTGLDIATTAVGVPELAGAIDTVKAGQTVAGAAALADALSSTNDVFKAGVSISELTRAQQIASGVAHLAEGASVGYGYDVANNLQSGKTGPAAFKPGLGSIIGSSLGALPGAIDIAGSAADLYKGMTPAERQAGFVRNPLSMFDDDTQNIGNVIKAKGVSREDFIAQMDDPSNVEAVEAFKADLATHDMSPSEFYDRANSPRDIAPKVKNLPYTQTEYNDFLDKLGITDEEYKNTLIKQGFDGVQLQDEKQPETLFESEKPISEPTEKGPAKITADMREELRNNGYTDAEIKTLTPEDATARIKENNPEFFNKESEAGEKAPKFLPADQEKIDQLEAQRQVQQEQLRDHPGRQLTPFISRKEGEYVELPKESPKNTAAQNLKIAERRARVLKASETAFSGTKYADEFDNEDRIKESIDQYRKMQDDYKDTVDQIKEAKTTARAAKLAQQDEEVANKFNDKQAEKEKAQTEKSQRVAERKQAFDEGVAKARSESERKADLRAKQNAEMIKEDKPLGFFQKIKNKLFPLDYLDKDTADAFRQWDGARKQAPVLAEREMGQINVPRGEGLDVILKYQAGKNTVFNNKIEEVFDGLYNEAKERGFDPGFRENYIPQVYKESSAQIKEVVRDYLAGKGMSAQDIDLYLEGSPRASRPASSLGLNPFFTKDRIFPDYKTAMEWGLTPRFTDPDQLAAYYRDQLEKNIANKNLLDKLTSTGKLIPEQIAPHDMVPVKYLPLGQRGYFANPRLADMLDGMFKGDEELSPLGSFAKTFAGVSKLTQQVALSAGVPFTDINFFSIGQVIKELTAGNYKVIPSFVRGFFGVNTDAVVKFFTENSEYADKLASTGFDIGNRVGTYGDVYDNWMNKFREAVNNARAPGGLGKGQTYKDFASLIGEGFNKVFAEKTFGSFMPQMYLQSFKDDYLSLLKSGMSDEDATALAGSITKKMAGITESVGRSQQTKDLLSSVLFAPKFRESMVNALWNAGASGVDFVRNLGGLTGDLDPTLQRSRKLLAGMAITFAGYNALNYKLNGHFMWDNPSGHQFDLRIAGKNGNITYVPFMPSFLTVARNLGTAALSYATGNFKAGNSAVESNLSQPLQITLSLIGNSDYYGDPIYNATDTTGQKLKKLAAYTGLELNHPYIKAVVNEIQKKQPIGELINNALELPLKFSNTGTENEESFFNEVDKQTAINAKADNEVKPIYQHIQQLVAQGDKQQAEQILNSLSDSQYAAYTRVKDSDDTKLTEKNEEAIFPTVEQVQRLVNDGQTQQAQTIINGLSDAQYKAYKLAKAKLPASQQY